MDIRTLTAHADQGAWAAVAADAVLLAAEHPAVASDLAALAVQAAMACCPHGRPASSDPLLAHDLARALEAVAAYVPPTIDPEAPGWKYLADRVAELQAERDAALSRIAHLERALADAWTPVSCAQRLAVALGCDECADAPPVYRPDGELGHIVERGVRGPGDPETRGDWAECRALALWEFLEDQRIVQLAVLPEQDYEGQTAR